MKGEKEVTRAFTNASGEFELVVKVLQNRDYQGVIKIKDTEGYYNSQIVEVDVPTNPGPEINVGQVEIMTNDGTGCQGDSNEAACFNKIKPKKGDLTVTVKNGLTGETL